MNEPWYDTPRVSQPGSVVLNAARDQLAAENAARRAQLGYAVQNAQMNPAEFSEFVAGVRAQSGGPLSERAAMSIAAVYACINLIGGAIASLPLHFYRRDSDGSRNRMRHDDWWLFNESPYPAWPAASAWMFALQSRMLMGDSFWKIHRKQSVSVSKDPRWYEPLHPSLVTVRRDPDRPGYLLYMVARADGGIEKIEQDDMLHIPGPGFDGLRGMSQLGSVLATVGGVARAAEQYSAAFFKNGARPDFVIYHEKPMTETQARMLREQWSETFGGPVRAHKPVVLSGGAEIKPITMNAVDAQLIETRKYTVEDICRIFGVPPFMIGHTEKTTSWGSGVEEMSLGFVKYTLAPHLVAFEQEINRKRFRADRGVFCEFSTAGLERGDLLKRSQAYRIALGRAGEPAWMTVNQVRALENMPAIDGGDVLPSNVAASAGAGATP